VLGGKERFRTTRQILSLEARRASMAGVVFPADRYLEARRRVDGAKGHDDNC
jgi:hypothetical protein